MTINYTVRADVVDIGTDTPKSADVFLVDSNVWYWMTYSNAPHGEPAWRSSVMSGYANYVKSADSVGSRLLWSGLSLAELSHLIEKTQREIYEAMNGPIKSKEFRHTLAAERSQVVAEIQSAWSQVKSLAHPLSATIDEPATDAALARLQTQFMDGYDLFILEAMTSNQVAQIITDDGDFATVPGIQVFTSNQNVLQAAIVQGRLIAR
jgi:predicted nucleic acid-binding protein